MEKALKNIIAIGTIGALSIFFLFLLGLKTAEARYEVSVKETTNITSNSATMNAFINVTKNTHSFSVEFVYKEGSKKNCLNGTAVEIGRFSGALTNYISRNVSAPLIGLLPSTQYCIHARIRDLDSGEYTGGGLTDFWTLKSDAIYAPKPDEKGWGDDSAGHFALATCPSATSGIPSDSKFSELKRLDALDGGDTNPVIQNCRYKYADVTDTTAVIYGVGGPDLTENPRLETTGYFRYTSVSERPPIYCNDIYGTQMRSTEDHDLGSDNGPVTFSSKITGLRPNTTYYYCAIVSNQNHIGYGGDRVVKSFRTLPCQTCDQTTVKTGEATTFPDSPDSAYLQGSYSSTKTVTTYFQYRKTPPSLSEQMLKIYSPEDRVLLENTAFPWQRIGTEVHSRNASVGQSYGGMYVTLENLSPETTYQYRAVAENSKEAFGLVFQDCPDNMTFESGRNMCIIRGDILSFTTPKTIDDDGEDGGPSDPTCQQYGTCSCNPGEVFDPTARECVSIDVFCAKNRGALICASRGPDLVASAVTAGQSVVGSPASYTATVSNVGNLQAGGSGQLVHSFQINDANKMYQDGNTVIKNITQGGLVAGNSQTIQISHTFTSAGIKRLRVCADWTGSVTETNENNNCGPWTAIWVAYPAPDVMAGPIETLTVLGGEFSEFIATVENIGSLPTTASFNNLFQYDTDEDHASGVFGFGGSSAGPLAASAEAKIKASNDFNAGLWYVRACADKVNTEDQYGTVDEGPDHAGEENNCGPWTTVAATCSAPEEYDSEEGKCVAPTTCAEDEIYSYSSGGCIQKTVCGEGETYIPYTNSCVSSNTDCSNPANAAMWYCQPGPGGPEYGWDPNGFLVGNWQGGGWIDGAWYGGEWVGADGRAWSGGVWKNGVWKGGYWRSSRGSGSGYGSGAGTGSGTGGELTLGQKATPPWDAIVRYHEGVEHVFQRQIVNKPEMQVKFGYVPGMDIYMFSWDAAHFLAEVFGYVDENGREIRVSYPDIAAYELRLSGDRLTIYEYYDGTVVSIQNITASFKSKADYEYYYKK